MGEGAWRILAGGTDFYPALGAKPLTENVLDINGLSELRGIAESATHIVIGARTSWTEIIRHPFPAVRRAEAGGARVGSIQIQNTGTVAGNICQRSAGRRRRSCTHHPRRRNRDRLGLGQRHEPLENFIRQSPNGARLGRNGDGDPRPKIAGRCIVSFKLGARRYLSSPSPWRLCGSRSVTTTGLPMRQSPSVHALRWRSACADWSRNCREESACARRSSLSEAHFAELRRSTMSGQRDLPPRRSAGDRVAGAGAATAAATPGEAG